MRPYNVQIAGNELSYTHTEKPLRDLLNDLEGGHTSSNDYSECRSSHSLRAGHKPGHSSELNLWMGTIEIGVDAWHFCWELLLKQNGLRFVCVSAEEGIEIAGSQISPDAFPWTAHELLIGAVKRIGTFKSALAAAGTA